MCNLVKLTIYDSSYEEHAQHDEKGMTQFGCDAARHRCTLSELIETALPKLSRPAKKRDQLAPPPTFRAGGTVDIADRDALYQAMEARCPLDFSVLVSVSFSRSH
jgi:hypothetical protein